MSTRPFNQKIAVGIVFVAALFMSLMDTTIVNVALPTIGREFHVPATSVSTVSIAFLVSLAVFIPASGWLGDRFGGKRVLLIAVLVFTLASALCGIARNLDELVIFRILQGAGGGMTTPVGMAMLYRVFPPEERVRASSILTLPVALAPAAGPVLGGLLVTDLSWRWVFYVNVPIGIGATIFGLLFLAPTKEANPGRFDLPGFLLAGIGLGLVMYGVSEGPTLSWHSVTVISTSMTGAVLLGLLVYFELRTAQPLIDFRMLKNDLFRVGITVIMLMAGSLIGVLYVITLFYQDGRGLSPLSAGLSTFPEAIGVMAGTQIASRLLYPRFGPRRMMSMGNLGLAVFVALLAGIGEHTSLWLARLILFGVGIMLAQVVVATQAASFATISPAATGRASTLFNAVRQLGGAIGVAAFTSVIVAIGAVHIVGGRATPNLDAYHYTFLVAGGVALLAALAALKVQDAEAIQTMPKRAQAQREAQASSAKSAVAAKA